MISETVLIGFLGQDPELKVFDSGSQVAKVSLATTEVYMKGNEKIEETEWHNLVAWGKLADILMKCKKGDRIYVKGRIKYRKWEHEGVERHATDIKIHTLRFLGCKRHGSDPETEQDSENPDD